MNIYKTSQVAKVIGIHPNTVRLYEKWGLIPEAERMENHYRVFTDFHIQQLQLARTAFRVEVLQNGLRKKIIKAVKASAGKDFDGALALACEYLEQIHVEKRNAEEATDIVKHLMQGEAMDDAPCMKRKEVSQYLDISMDTLRNWELNGLLKVKRRENGYRIYTSTDIKYLKIIRVLRCASYSLESILHMLNEVSQNPGVNINKVLNTPQREEDIISVCDHLIISLEEAAQNARTMINMITDMKLKFS